jgi:hypothetical protein
LFNDALAYGVGTPKEDVDLHKVYVFYVSLSVCLSFFLSLSSLFYIHVRFYLSFFPSIGKHVFLVLELANMNTRFFKTDTIWANLVYSK